MKYELIVIGAGAGGLFTASLAQALGLKTLLLESHSLPGGCASYFYNQGLLTDAGATTLAGLSEGRPLFKIAQKLKLNFKDLLIPYNDGFVLSLNDQIRIHFSNNQAKFYHDLEQINLKPQHQHIWKQIFETSTLGWNTLNSITSHPFNDLSSLINKDLLKLIRPTFMSTESFLQEYKDHHELLKFINGLLLISTQSDAKKVPFLFGAMALTYPTEVVCLKGGMKGLWDRLLLNFKNNGGTFLTNHKVNLIQKNKNVFLVSTHNKNQFVAPKIVSNQTIWDQHFFENQKVLKPSNEFAWGAFCLYLKSKFKQPMQKLYHQIHLSDQESYFVSFSHPQDELRMKNEFQSTTISTHVKTQEWFNLSNEAYQLKKIGISKKNFIFF